MQMTAENSFCRIGYVLALTMALAVPGHPARADDTKPFSFESFRWMSFDHYKEKTDKGNAAAEPSDASNSPTVASNPETETPAQSPATPVVAQPARLLDLPVMPGMNKGYAVKVNSTQDEEKAPGAQITNLDDKPTVQLSEKNWQSPVAAPHGMQTPDNGEDNTAHPLNVRMSFLPSRQITPVLDPERKSYHERATAALSAHADAPAGVKEPKQSASDPASCAAVDAFKKKQMEDIQSDRRTLAALQAAISQLGLNKELSFMTGATGSLAQTGTTPVKMDFPVSSAQAPPVKSN